MEDADAKRAFLALASGEAMLGVFNEEAARQLGAVPVVDIFGRTVAITHAYHGKSAAFTFLHDCGITDKEIVGWIDKASVERANYAISIITPASVVYRGFVHFNTVPVEKKATTIQDLTGSRDFACSRTGS